MVVDLNMILALIGIGLITGIAAGLFGTGGGTILIPVLLIIFQLLGYSKKFDIHVAIGTSLTLVITTTISSTISHYLRHHLDFKVALKWIPGVCVGVLLGVTFVHFVPAFWLKVFFAVYLLFCIFYNVFKKELKHDKDVLSPAKRKLLPLGTFVGCIATMLGIGGGTFTTPILTFLHYPLKNALAISSLTGLFIGTIGASILVGTSLHLTHLPPYTFGYLNWLVFLCVAPTAMIGSPIGVYITDKLSKSTLKNTYTGFLCVIFALLIFHMIRQS
jgi:uncharacterized membrane protein YfcA